MHRRAFSGFDQNQPRGDHGHGEPLADGEVRLLELVQHYLKLLRCGSMGYKSIAIRSYHAW